MWYSGLKIDTLRIGHAISPDGITWTKDPNNPVIDVGPAGAWDDPGVDAGDVLVIDSVFHMWYTGIPNRLIIFTIGHATSPDGINWTKDPNNPVLIQGPNGDLDSKWILHGKVVYTDGTFQMWYSGWDGSLLTLSASVTLPLRME